MSGLPVLVQEIVLLPKSYFELNTFTACVNFVKLDEAPQFVEQYRPSMDGMECRDFGHVGNYNIRRLSSCVVLVT